MVEWNGWLVFPVDLAYLVDTRRPDRQLPALYAAHHVRRHRVVLVQLNNNNNNSSTMTLLTTIKLSSVNLLTTRNFTIERRDFPPEN